MDFNPPTTAVTPITRRNAAPHRDLQRRRASRRPIPSVGASPAATKFDDEGMHLLALGDYGSGGNPTQIAVADRMTTFAKSLAKPLTAVLALGDNFYKKLTPDRFDKHFEKIYSPAALNCPFYACPGNHDYGTAKYDLQIGKLQMQLDYAKNHPESRWKMPAKWYTVHLPTAEKPLVKVVILDGNYWEGALTPKEKVAQRRFLKAELKQNDAPWLWVVNHFPLYSDCPAYSENKPLIRDWGPLVQKYPVSLFISGHAHILQHLHVEGYKSSFVVSGGGGAMLYPMKDSKRGFVTNQHLGFNHIYVTPEEFHVQFIDPGGDCLHHFRRDQAGKVTVLI